MGVNNIKALWLRMTRCGRFRVVFPYFVPILMLLYYFNALIWSTIITAALLIYIGWERQDNDIRHDEENYSNNLR